MSSNSQTLPNTTLSFPILFLLMIITLPKTASSSTSTLKFTDDHHKTLSKNLSPGKFGHLKREKLSHLHFYFHDVVGGKDPTTVKIAEAKMSNTSLTGFGYVAMMDDPLTVGPERTSKQLGRAQGMYASASQHDLGLLMVLNYVFTEGKYNGSTISILGRNVPLSAVREMPIVGGTGIFRFSRGYAQARTHKFDLKTAIVEYNVYVLHYL